MSRLVTYGATKEELREAGYFFYGAQHECSKHHVTLEHYFLPNDHGGVRDHQYLCPEEGKTIIDIFINREPAQHLHQHDPTP